MDKERSETWETWEVRLVCDTHGFPVAGWGSRHRKHTWHRHAAAAATAAATAAAATITSAATAAAATITAAAAAVHVVVAHDLGVGVALLAVVGLVQNLQQTGPAGQVVGLVGWLVGWLGGLLGVWVGDSR